MNDLIEITEELFQQGIYTVIEREEENGAWIFINGDSGYRADKWTVEEAIADYLSPESAVRRLNDFYQALGFWD